MQLIFVHVEIDNEDVGKPVSEYFGISGNGPQVIFFFFSFPLLYLFPDKTYDLTLSSLRLGSLNL